MPIYLTVQGLVKELRESGLEYSEKTIRRWIDEGRDITFGDRHYAYQKDPGGGWYFVVTVALRSEGDAVRHPVPLRPRRRILSGGIK